MPAQVRSVAGSNSGSAASTTMTAAMPPGFVADDLLVSVAFSALAAAPSARGGGATALRNIADASFNADVVWKKAVGGDTFSWTVTSRKWAVVTVAIVAGTWDAVSVSPFHVENGVNFTSTTASGTLTTPAVTVAAADTLLLAAFGNAGASTYTVPAQTPPMTLGAQTTSSGTSPASAALIHSALNAVAQGSISRTATASVAVVNACMWIGAVNPSTTPTQAKFRGVPVGTRRQTAVNSAANW
jgi:hypothetical protein